VKEALGLLEMIGLTPTLVALDAMEKSGKIRIIQCELNDFYGVCTKIAGAASAVHTAIEAGRRIAARMGGNPVASVILRPDADAMKVILSAREHNPLIQQEVVFFPESSPTDNRQTNSSGDPSLRTREEDAVGQTSSFALGLIETQGFTAVFEAIDTACKAANVEVIGKEKLGGGYVTIVIRGELSAVTAAVEAGKEKVDGLGKLIAAHVIARPSPAVLALLPKT
jgi:carbon dioxide concentrating mechanism protein CcmO